MALTGLLECVANVSEGRDAAVVEALASACGPALLDVHVDPDHHRSVFTLAGPPPLTERSTRRLAQVCVDRIDVSRHEGVHPRLGALDVVPFVALDPALASTAVTTAQRFATWLGESLHVPTFLYGDADEARRSLPDVRREAFSSASPDYGPSQPHPTAGASAVGVRPVLVAVNCDLTSGDAAIAREIAGAVRDRDGGLPGVRALGWLLATRGVAQVSMNLVDLDATGVEVACSTVRTLARDRGTDVAGVELVGLLPASEFNRCSEEFRTWSGLDAGATIEERLAAREASR